VASTTDEDLIAQYRLSPDAPRARALLDELFRRHQTRVVTWCYRFCGERDLAADLAQDVFAKAYTSLHTFRSDAKFTTWLYVITRNRCRDELRARQVRPRSAPEDAIEDAGLTEENTALSTLDAHDARVVVQRLMRDSLDETEIRVMTLHYGHGMRLDAITAALGLTNVSGAKAFIVSAKRKLNLAVKQWKMKS
jgi:RNA polymerase sigma-70 factor, ECF subfamily